MLFTFGGTGETEEDETEFDDENGSSFTFILSGEVEGEWFFDAVRVGDVSGGIWGYMRREADKHEGGFTFGFDLFIIPKLGGVGGGGIGLIEEFKLIL